MYSTYVAKDIIISKDVFYYKAVLNPNISCSQLVLYQSQNRDSAQLINIDPCFLIVSTRTVQLNSNLILAWMSLAERLSLLLSTLASWLRAHKHASYNLWQMTLVRHAKFLE